NLHSQQVPHALPNRIFEDLGPGEDFSERRQFAPFALQRVEHFGQVLGVSVEMPRVDGAELVGEVFEIGRRMDETGAQNRVVLYQRGIALLHVWAMKEEPHVASRRVPSILEEIARPRGEASNLMRAVEEKLGRHPARTGRSSGGEFRRMMERAHRLVQRANIGATKPWQGGEVFRAR